MRYQKYHRLKHDYIPSYAFVSLHVHWHNINLQMDILKLKYLEQLSMSHFPVRVHLFTVIKLNTSKIKGTAAIVFRHPIVGAVLIEQSQVLSV